MFFTNFPNFPNMLQIRKIRKSLTLESWLAGWLAGLLAWTLYGYSLYACTVTPHKANPTHTQQRAQHSRYLCFP